MPSSAIFTIIVALILILAVPHIITATVKRKGNRKGLAIISKIIGWALLILTLSSIIRDLI